jgi:hypothetical protein
MSSSGRQAWKYSYGVNPIFLTGGLASNLPGGVMPIINLLQPGDFPQGPTGAGTSGGDEYFAEFKVLPGGLIISNEFGKYPFANQVVAANAVIKQPLVVSLMMICPATDVTTWSAKLQTMTALKASLEQHSNSGGTFTVATPSLFYANGLLEELRDVSDSSSNQPQLKWQWDFWFPLLTLESAQAAMNGLMNMISGGQQLSGDPPAWSGLGQTVGNAGTGQASSIMPGGSGAAGTNIGTGPQ